MNMFSNDYFFSPEGDIDLDQNDIDLEEEMSQFICGSAKRFVDEIRKIKINEIRDITKTSEDGLHFVVFADAFTFNPTSVAEDFDSSKFANFLRSELIEKYGYDFKIKSYGDEQDEYAGLEVEVEASV